MAGRIAIVVARDGDPPAEGRPCEVVVTGVSDGSEVARPRNAVLVSEANESTGALVSPGVSRNVFRRTTEGSRLGRVWAVAVAE